MAIAVRGTPTVGEGGAGSLVVNKPTGVQNQDFLIAFGVVNSGTITAAPSGWALLHNEGGYYVYTKTASSEGASWTWTLSGFVNATMGVIAYSGVDVGTQQDITFTSVASGISGSTIVPGGTTVTDNAWFVPIALQTFGSNAVTWTAPAGFTKDAQFTPTTQSNNIAIGHKVISPAGATGTSTWTTTDSGNNKKGVGVFLRPANIAYTGRSGTGAGSGTGTATTGSLGTSVSGNFIVVIASTNSATSNDISSVTDSVGNTYSRAISTPGNGTDTEIWYCANITGAAGHTVTATAAVGFRNVNITAQEYSGIVTTLPLDKSTGGTASSATASSGATATTTQANELVVGGVTSTGTAVTFTVGAGYSNLVSNTASATLRSAIESAIVSATGAQTATFGLSGSFAWTCAVATFKGSVSGGGAVATPSKLALLGVG